MQILPSRGDLVLSDFLLANKVRAVLVESRNEVHTAAQAAKELNVPLSSIVKSVLFMVDGEPVLVVLPGSARVSVSKVCALRNAKECRLAFPEEVVECTGYEVGAVPPISVYGIPTLLDEQLKAKEQLVCGGGSLKRLLKISLQEIERVGFDVRVADVSGERLKVL